MFDDLMEDFEEVSELYVVEAAVIVVVRVGNADETIRIEAVRRIRHDGTQGFETRGFIERDVIITPAFGEDEEYGTAEPEHSRVFVPWDELPWTDGESAEEVIRLALFNLIS